MVNQLVIILGVIMVLSLILIIYKKPEVIKKNSDEPLSVKNFSLKKTFIGDWKSFAIWIILMFLVWSYTHDTASCREFMADIDKMCAVHMGQIQYTASAQINFDELNITGGEDRAGISWSGNQQGSSYTIPADS